MPEIERLTRSASVRMEGTIYTTVKPRTVANIQEIINRLADYESQEEQGLLIRLPCKDIYASQGNTVYLICDGEIVEVMNLGVGIDPNGEIICTLLSDEDIFPYREPDPEHDDFADWCKNTIEVKPDDFGKTVFLTKEEAEKALPHD